MRKELYTTLRAVICPNLIGPFTPSVHVDTFRGAKDREVQARKDGPHFLRILGTYQGQLRILREDIDYIKRGDIAQRKEINLQHSIKRGDGRGPIDGYMGRKNGNPADFATLQNSHNMPKEMQILPP